MAAGQQLQHLIEQSRGGHVFDQLGHPVNRLARGLVDREAELGGKPHRAQHAHRVFAIAVGRVADHAQPARAQILDAVVIVEHVARGRVVIERVDREVAPRRIFVLLAVQVVGQHAAVFVDQAVDVDQRAKRRHLDRLLAEHHVHQLEAAADDERAPKMRLDLLRRGIGGDVEVLRRDVEQQVAHGAADDVRAMAGFLQRLAHAQRGARDELAIDMVFARRNALRLATAALRLALEKRLNPFNDALDHAAPVTCVGSNSCSVCQPRSCAIAISRASPLVTTGCVARSSSGKSLIESP